MVPALLAFTPSSVPSDAPPGPSVVRIVRSGDAWTLTVDGKPFALRGAVGGRDARRLVEAGGNAIRGGPRDLDRAHALGLKVLVGLPFGKPRWGFDFTDAAQVSKQLEEILAIVRANRNHPAVLMWALGNEMEIFTTKEQRRPLWRAVNEAARAIRAEDPSHPVITVVGDLYRTCLHELDAECPDLDAVGLNAYVDMLTMPEDVAREGWKRPYLVTEFGPRGHWQVPRTPWGMPIEDTSTEKAEHYERAYRHAVMGRPQCLGAFVFHWAWHHEKTHTWYGMFLQDGSATQAVEVMQRLWTGDAPTNLAPRVGTIAARSGEARSAERWGEFAAGALIECEVAVTDPDSDPLAIAWDLRVDVADNPNVGGDREETTVPIEGAVEWSEAGRARVRLPRAAGKYRLFVTARDGRGWAAAANLPILAR